jgi:hypothetical protein
VQALRVALACSAAAAAVSLVSVPACVNGRDCMLVGCTQGVEIDFAAPLAEGGTYTITVDVDGARTTCAAVVPPPEAPGRPCDQDLVGVHYGYVDGSATRVILGLGVAKNDAKTITVRVMRDGTELASTTFTPAYTTNGCDPSCAFAQKEL